MRISDAGALNARFCTNRQTRTCVPFSPREAQTYILQTFPPLPLLRPPIVASAAQISSSWGGTPAVISKSFCVGALRGTYHYPDVFVRPVSRQLSVLVLPASRIKTLCLHVSLLRSSPNPFAEIDERSSHCLGKISINIAVTLSQN